MNFDHTRLRLLAAAFFFFGLFVLALGAGMFLFRGQGISDDVQIILGESTGRTENEEPASQATRFDSARRERGEQRTKNKEIELININTASERELDTLPGVGPVTAAKIIASRPYSAPEDLLTKKVVGRSTYEKIRDLISY